MSRGSESNVLQKSPSGNNTNFVSQNLNSVEILRNLQKCTSVKVKYLPIQKYRHNYNCDLYMNEHSNIKIQQSHIVLIINF